MWELTYFNNAVTTHGLDFKCRHSVYRGPSPISSLPPAPRWPLSWTPFPPPSGFSSWYSCISCVYIHTTCVYFILVFLTLYQGTCNLRDVAEIICIVPFSWYIYRDGLRRFHWGIAHSWSSHCYAPGFWVVARLLFLVNTVAFEHSSVSQFSKAVAPIYTLTSNL